MIRMYALCSAVYHQRGRAAKTNFPVSEELVAAAKSRVAHDQQRTANCLDMAWTCGQAAACRPHREGSRRGFAGCFRGVEPVVNVAGDVSWRAYILVRGQVRKEGVDGGRSSGRTAEGEEAGGGAGDGREVGAVAAGVDTDMVDGGAGEVACEKKLTIGVYDEALQVRVERVF